MCKITIQGDNSPAGILRHWERKTRQECAREILRCWQERDTLRTKFEQAEAKLQRARQLAERIRDIAIDAPASNNMKLIYRLACQQTDEQEGSGNE